MHSWQLQHEKTHVSDVVKAASAGQPQEITLRGKPTVVVLSTQQDEELIHPQPHLVDFLRQSPLMNLNLEIRRDTRATRDIDV